MTKVQLTWTGLRSQHRDHGRRSMGGQVTGGHVPPYFLKWRGRIVSSRLLFGGRHFEIHWL